MPSPSRKRVPPILVAVVVVVAVAVAVAAVLVVRGAGASGGASAAGRESRPGSATASGGQAAAAMANPLVDPGTPLLGRPAPGFTLTDQFGAAVSLSQFRGRAVVLAFVDSRCTTICPLTTESLVDAVRLLGPAADRRVQLVGVDANPDATAVADVRDYSRSHEMMHSWRFLTGSRAQLAAVWRAYHVYVAAVHGNIDHQPAVYLIDRAGRERMLYMTQMAYAGAGQQAQIIADGLARLLPGHLAPRRVVSLRYRPGVKPAEQVSVPVIDGGRQPTLRLGPGSARLLVFVASWLSEVSDLPRELALLRGYQRAAARQGLPGVVVVDETTTEPTPRALAPSLARAAAGGRLGYPVVSDPAGRVADGYGVTGMPWVEAVSARGRVVFRHDGWLALGALETAARRAQLQASG